MTAQLIDERQIQDEIEQLKTQFPQTRDLYREVCVLLFFRYGITPSANKLYQYVRKGSMSAPAEALNRFWLELREKSRVRIESPDLPDHLKEETGKFAATLWLRAQEAAKSNFATQITEANEKVELAQQEKEIAQQNCELLEAKLNQCQDELENASQRLVESEKKHAVDMSVLAALEKSLITRQKERMQLERSLEAARQEFSSDLDKVNVALAKAEERYRALEARALLDLDRERQRAIKLEKEISKSGDDLQRLNQRHLKELAAAKEINADVREKLGMLNGQITQVKEHQKQTVKKLEITERKLVTCNSKLTQLQLTQLQSKRSIREKKS